jgi:ribosomal protein S18 acetylase RimI-like enzyme
LGQSFRAAELNDVPALHALVESAFRGDVSRRGWTTEADLLDGQRTDPQALDEIIDSPDSMLLLATCGDEVVACCQLRIAGAEPAYVGMVAVSPERQGGGLGAALLAEAERRAADAGAARMRMTVIRQRAELIAWYERRGYVRTGETAPFPYGDERYGVPRRDDLEFVVLEKPLA